MINPSLQLWSLFVNVMSVFIFLQELDFEVELAFVIGKTGKKIKVN